MAGLLRSVDQAMQEGRKNILASHASLAKVADYCETNYMQADEKNRTKALEETKSYLNQSLASVAYQVNHLATNFLHQLDIHSQQLAHLECEGHYINRTFNIHSDKVGRRIISGLTTKKDKNKSEKIISLGVSYEPEKYRRKAIDYTSLDQIGLGVIIQEASEPVSTIDKSVPLPKLKGTANAGIYRQPPSSIRPVAPPSLPDHSQSDEPEHVKDHQSHIESHPGHTDSNQQMDLPFEFPEPYPSDSELPPPPPAMVKLTVLGSVSDSLESNQQQMEFRLPPPPDDLIFPPPPMPLPPPASIDGDHCEPDWVPHTYKEKCLALYDYRQEFDYELTLKKFDIIYVTEKNENGWWRGVTEGMEGFFPCSYVEPCK